MPPSTLLPDMMTDEYITRQTNLIDPIKLNLSAKGLVNFQGINSTNIALVKEGVGLQIVSAKDLDDQPDQLNNPELDIYRFDAPVYPLESVVRARDIQNLKPIPGSGQTEPQLIEEVIIDKVDRMKKSYALTKEFILINMLKGKIMKDASTTLVNLYTKMSVTQQTVNFDFADAADDILSKCQEVANKITDKLNDVSTGIEVQCSAGFFSKLIAHPKVQAAYQNYMGNSNVIVEGIKANRFPFGGLIFERNPTSINGTAFIETDVAYAYPTGTQDTFQGTYSPADMTAYANTKGMETYISTHDLKHGKGVELHAESRPVAICKNLNALVKLTVGADA